MQRYKLNHVCSPPTLHRDACDTCEYVCRLRNSGPACCYTLPNNQPLSQQETSASDDVLHQGLVQVNQLTAEYTFVALW